MSEQAALPKFEAHLQRGGTGVPEMKRLLRAYADHEDIDKLKDQVFKEHLLGKTSTDMEKDVFYAFRRRFIRPNDLPPTSYVAYMMKSRISEAAKTQLLFPYFLAADPMATYFYQELVLGRLSSSQSSLQIGDVYTYFEVVSQTHPEIAKWSNEVRRRWCRGFIFFLRQFNLLEPKPGVALRRLWLLPEVFAFYWLWFWYKDESYHQAYQNPWWALLQVDQISKREFLTEGQSRNWWLLQQAGEIVQFQPKYRSLLEWIDHGLV